MAWNHTARLCKNLIAALISLAEINGAQIEEQNSMSTILTRNLKAAATVATAVCKLALALYLALWFLIELFIPCVQAGGCQ